MSKNPKPAKRKAKPADKAVRKATHVAPTRKKDDPATYPFLGRVLTWVDRPGNPTRLFWALAGLCAFLFLLDFTYAKHGHFHIEDYPGFYGIYGFVMFTGLILAAKALRVLIKQPEDFYGDKAVDREDYPEDQLERTKHNV